jgi:hypothetical protein
VKAPRQREPKWPWDQVNLDLHEISAIKVMASQNAVAFAAILKICGDERMSYTHGGEDGRRATDFAEGRRWVGLALKRARDATMPGPKQHGTGPHAGSYGPPPGE